MNIYLNDETGEWITEEEYESGPDLYEDYEVIGIEKLVRLWCCFAVGSV